MNPNNQVLTASYHHQGMPVIFQHPKTVISTGLPFLELLFAMQAPIYKWAPIYSGELPIYAPSI